MVEGRTDPTRSETAGHMRHQATRNRETFRGLLLCVLGIALVALVPWIVSRIAFPAEPFDASVIYRSQEGDIEYFPLVAELARGTVTDETIKESRGALLRPFPHVTLLPHAVSVAAFGSYGFVVADVLAAISYLLLLVLLFRTVGVSHALSIMAAFCVALRIPVYLLDSAGLPAVFTLWGMRIPRPFISELYLLLTLIATWRLLVNPARVIHWLVLAGALGLLVQGDIHAVLIFALSSPALMFVIVRREGVLRTLRNSVYAGLFLAVVMSPFLVQHFLEHPDIPVRWGMFPMRRLSGFRFFWELLSWKELIGVTFAASFVLFVGTRSRPQEDVDGAVGRNEGTRHVWFYSAALMIAALVSMPVSVVVLGAIVQPSHFWDRASRLYSYVVIAFLVVWIDAFLRRRGERADRGTAPVGRAYFYGTIVALLVIGLGYKMRESSVYRNHLRPQFFGAHTVATQPSYRESFSELASFLDRNVPHDAVVATFDHQVFSWWLTFHRGYSFLVEPFVSSVSDAELETRLAVLCRQLGMSPEDYREFVQEPYINIFWLGLLKYEASRWYTYSSLDDYTDEQRLKIVRSRDFWQMIIPQSELRRLGKHYENLTSVDVDARALDIIVLSNRGPEKHLAPAAGVWQSRFQNDGFRVYSRSAR